jgi:hypothetical protein
MVDIRKFIISFILVTIGQIGSWFQLYGHIKFDFMKNKLWLILLTSIPLTWIYYQSTKIAIEAFGGQTWPVRFVGFSSGIIVFMFMAYFIGETFQLKNLICLLLCLMIIGIQILWK